MLTFQKAVSGAVWKLGQKEHSAFLRVVFGPGVRTVVTAFEIKKSLLTLLYPNPPFTAACTIFGMADVEVPLHSTQLLVHLTVHLHTCPHILKYLCTSKQ